VCKVKIFGLTGLGSSPSLAGYIVWYELLYFAQINVGCGVNTGTMGAVSLEFYYLNSNVSWSPVIDRCNSNDQCTNSHEETIYYSTNYGQWTRITVVINEGTSSRFVHLLELLTRHMYTARITHTLITTCSYTNVVMFL